MVKRYSKRIIRKKTYRLSPKEAEDILKQEYIDSRGNKYDFRFKFKPHKPSEPTIQSTVEYRDEQ